MFSDKIFDDIMDIYLINRFAYVKTKPFFYRIICIQNVCLCSEFQYLWFRNIQCIIFLFNKLINGLQWLLDNDIFFLDIYLFLKIVSYLNIQNKITFIFQTGLIYGGDILIN